MARLVSGSCVAVLTCLLLGLGGSVLIVRNHLKSGRSSSGGSSSSSMVRRNQSSTCSLFVGNWVHDSSYTPLYDSSKCPTIIEPEFNCRSYGRPDSDYLKYRWQPVNCDLPSFSGLAFLEQLRGKTVMFVGDSLGRNQWESLICMIYASAHDSDVQLIRGDPLSTFKFLDYSVTLLFYKAPYLVDIEAVQGRRVLKLDDISANGGAWLGADVLSFNTGHWWSHTGSLQGWDYMQYEGETYRDMDRLKAMEIGLKTWASWADSNIDQSRTKVFFLSISPTHDNPAEWSGGASTNCYKETQPITNSVNGASLYPEAYADQLKVMHQVMAQMSNPPFFLDITMLSELRKDAHPSIYSGKLSPGQRANPAQSSDCSHWCLPGLPDTWNQLFYTALFS